MLKFLNNQTSALSNRTTIFLFVPFGYACHKFPIIIREIDVKPNKIFKMNKPSDDQISECLASIFTVVVEFLDVPESISSSLRKNAAVYRMLEYQAL